MARNQKRKKIWALLISMIFLFLLAGGSLTYYWNQLKHEEKPLPKEDKALGIVTKKEKPKKEPIFAENKEIYNILLLGVDQRERGEETRSDTMIILTMDYKHNEIKMSSIMRDLYVPIEGYEDTRLNHAYAYGGPLLTIQTINQYMDIDIRDYATVDFFGLEKAINEIGGITIDIKEEEIPYINEYMQETADIQNKEVTPIVESGEQVLNGMQAVSYARLRKIGGDFERTERQRYVLEKIMEKTSHLSKTELLGLVETILPEIETSLSKKEIAMHVWLYAKRNPMPIYKERFPKDGEWQSERIRKMSVLTVDQEEMQDSLHSFIYEKQSESIIP